MDLRNLTKITFALLALGVWGFFLKFLILIETALSLLIIDMYEHRQINYLLRKSNPLIKLKIPLLSLNMCGCTVNQKE